MSRKIGWKTSPGLALWERVSAISEIGKGHSRIYAVFIEEG
jgi:hypothetical protein